ncbi:MAG: DNA adenine methylase, partial [Lachnospiraceae bacterium]|nr:DNA adenine methylase [Lachnospiraceae bacterium]
MEHTAILNYPGSKRRLIDFIYNNSKDLIDTNKIILDIFSGTGCVAQFYKNQGFKVVTNDTEIYSYHIANAILNGFDKTLFNIEDFKNNISHNQNQLFKIFQSELDIEKKLIQETSHKLTDFDDTLPKIFNLKRPFSINGIVINGIDDLNIHISEIPFCLFTLYYSGSYFGLLQSIAIDSIRYAIEKTDKNIKSVLLT